MAACSSGAYNLTRVMNIVGIKPLLVAILFRTRSGAPYRAETLSHDFADLRKLTFPGDKRRLADTRAAAVWSRRWSGTRLHSA